MPIGYCNRQNVRDEVVPSKSEITTWGPKKTVGFLLIAALQPSKRGTLNTELISKMCNKAIEDHKQMSACHNADHFMRPCRFL